MYARVQAQLERQTGEDLAAWNGRIRAEPELADEPSLRAWLADRGVTGYPAMLLVFERFGYPDYLQRDADDLIDGQYRDRPALRAVYERIVEVVLELGQVELQARKTYVALIGPRRTFASIQATTRTRVDIGLRLDGVAAQPGGRLEVARSIGQSSMTHKIGVAAPAEVDGEVVAWLRRAYQANL
jgi:hypothetical protein